MAGIDDCEVASSQELVPAVTTPEPAAGTAAGTEDASGTIVAAKSAGKPREAHSAGKANAEAKTVSGVGGGADATSNQQMLKHVLSDICRICEKQVLENQRAVIKVRGCASVSQLVFKMLYMDFM